MEVSGKHLDIENEQCVPCQTKGESRRPDGYCKDCKKYMCHKCFQDHLKVKHCRKHVLSGLDEKSTSLPKKIDEEQCNKHKADIIKYYCRKHDIVGCGFCMIPDHGSCRPVAISHIAKQYDQNSEFKKIVRQIQLWADENTERKIQMQKSKRENQSSRDSALNEIRKFRQEINSYIDKLELQIITETEQKAKENENRLAKVEKTIASVEKEIANIKDNIDTNMYHDDSLFIQMIKCKPGLKTIEQKVSEIKALNKITAFVFEGERKLKDLTESDVKFGRLISITKETLKRPVVGTIAEPVVAHRLETKSTSESDVVKHAYTDGAHGEFAQKQTFFPPDPRAAGFDVNARVKSCDVDPFSPRERYGTVLKVHSAGYITVRWDDGETESRIRAGDGGKFDVGLLSK